MKIEETFRVDAPVERVWAYLIDPQQVVQCLPGAELLEVEDEQTFLGRVKVKVGPVNAAFKGRARFTELDEASRRVRMVGEGREAGGGGSAKMTMTSEMAAVAEGGAEVRVEAEVEVVGKLAQFGRGLMEEVSKQLFRQFASCVQAQLAQPAAAEGSDRPEAESSPESAPPAPPAEAAMATAASGIPPTETPRRPAPPPPAAAAPRQQASPAPAAAAEPVRALPLLFRAIVSLIRNFFARLFGR